MDPLLKQLSDDQLRSLLSEQRPPWAVPLGQGRPEVRAPQDEAGPPLPSELQTYRTRAAQAYDRGQDSLSRKAPFSKQVVDALLALGDPRALQKLLPPQSVAEGFAGSPMAVGVLAGKKAAKALGHLVEGKFHAGVQALERGEAPQAVWRTWGVSRTTEGKYVFEPPLVEGESDAIHQFSSMYPDVALKIYRRGGNREGWYDPETKEIFAQGRTDLPMQALDSRRRVLEHELQHAADAAEGHSYGTNLADPNYWKNAAEVRARAAEKRLDPEERRWEPSMSEDVDRLKQIIKSTLHAN